MSSTRRKRHRLTVAYQQLATDLRRTFQQLHDTGKGPWAPGPWWPEGHEKHIPGEEWLKAERARLAGVGR